MKKTMKRIISLLLAAVLTAAGAAVVAFAAENGIVLSGNAGENVTWTLTGDGVLTVSGSGPILDDTIVEVDEEGCTTTTLIGSIGMSLSDYFDTLVAGLDADEAARVRIDMVKEIVVEEGITEIPDDEFGNVCPRKVTLPSSLESFGYSAFDGLFAQEVIVNSVKVPFVQFYAAAYENGEEPYADLEAAIEGYIEQCRQQEAYEYALLPLDALRTWAEVVLDGENAWWNDCSEEDKADCLERYNAYLGTDETELEALVPAALTALNERYGTAFADVTEIFTLETDEYGFTELLIDEALQEMLDAESDALYNNGRLVPVPINFEDDAHTFYGWLTVTAPAGGQIEADCKASGVNFNALEGVTVPAKEEENETLCKFCGRDHSGSIWQKFIGFLHKIFYFFAHLFGKM